MSKTALIVGFDPSLTAFGVANILGTESLKTKFKGPARLDFLTEELGWKAAGCDLVAIEGYSYGSSFGGERLGELGGCVRLMLWRLGIPYVEIPPTSLKKYATGKGNAIKGAVLEAALKYSGLEFEGDDNQADAWWLRAMALDHYGFPLCNVPTLNRTAITAQVKRGKAAIEWPAL